MGKIICSLGKRIQRREFLFRYKNCDKMEELAIAKGKNSEVIK